MFLLIFYFLLYMVKFDLGKMEQNLDKRKEIIEDLNKNDIWDTGNYLNKVQPEKVYYSNFELDVRANWDFNETLNLNEVQMDSIQSN